MTGADRASHEQSIYSELLGLKQLERHARELAARRIIGTHRGTDRLLSRLASNERSFDAAYAALTAAVAGGSGLTPAAEWFVDNFRFIGEQVRIARRHLPRGYSRQLPRVAQGPTAGMPRVYEMVLELIAHSHGRVDLETLRTFVGAYQSGCPLKLGELWAIPIMLRLALLDNLRGVVANVTDGRDDRNRAGYWIERMLASTGGDPTKSVLALADMVRENPRITNPFAAEFTARLQAQRRPLVFAAAWLDQQLAERGQTAEHVFALAGQSQAADQVAVSNCVAGLRLLGTTDWRDFVEKMSVVERLLARDPAAAYTTMDFATRDRYRHVIETIARRSGRSEAEVAEAAVRLSSAATTGRQTHIGYFLIDRGRPALHRAVGIRQLAVLSVSNSATPSWISCPIASVIDGPLSDLTRNASAPASAMSQRCTPAAQLTARHNRRRTSA